MNLKTQGYPFIDYPCKENVSNSTLDSTPKEVPPTTDESGEITNKKTSHPFLET